MSQPGGGQPPGSMAPGPPRSLGAMNMQGGLMPGMQPGPQQPSVMAPGQPPALSMAPFGLSSAPPGQPPPTTLPIQPLNMAPAPPPTSGAPNRSLAPGPIPGDPVVLPLSISPLNMNTNMPPAAPPNLAIPPPQSLNLGLFTQSLSQQPNTAASAASGPTAGLKRSADSTGVPDAKRMRSESDSDASAPLALRATSATPPLPLSSQAAAQLPQPSQPSQSAPGAAGPGPGPAAAASSGVSSSPDVTAMMAGRPNPYQIPTQLPAHSLAAAALQMAAVAQAAQAAQTAQAQAAQAQANQAAAAAVAAAAARRRALAAATVPDPDEDRKLLPRRGIRMALRGAGMDKDFVVDPATEAALQDFYSEWIASAVAMGCEVAKRRKSSVLKARDIALHLERSWNLYVPGFNGEMLRPYRRPNASELHRQRQLAVRRTAAELDHQQQQHPHQGQQHQDPQAQPGAQAGPGGAAGLGAASGGVAGTAGG